MAEELRDRGQAASHEAGTLTTGTGAAGEDQRLHAGAYRTGTWKSRSRPDMFNLADALKHRLSYMFKLAQKLNEKSKQ